MFKSHKCVIRPKIRKNTYFLREFGSPAQCYSHQKIMQKNSENDIQTTKNYVKSAIENQGNLPSTAEFHL